jgi:hypothetical protein
MHLLTLRAYSLLVVLDFYLVRGSFEALYCKVRNFPVAHKTSQPEVTETLCSAVDMACIWYPKEVLCLQRSAATACLLRKYGIPAQMIIGAQRMPFKAHAWVEVNGDVVNDKPYMPEMYVVLDRC